MKISLSPLKLFCIASFVFAFNQKVSADLVVNGGFESGAFAPGWTLTDADPMGSLSNVGSNPMFAHSGTFHANLGTLFPPASLTIRYVLSQSVRS